MSKFINKYIYLSCLSFLVVGFASQTLLAQSTDSRLEEVVVTAQKREEGLSEVPISIQVLSADRLDDIGITSWEGLAQYVPGLQVAKGVQEQSIYMRGVGSGTNKGFEQSVSQFVDGMSVSRSQQYSVPLLDVQRIEVLKGTQGVLFGKNTIAGVINTVSKSPVIGGDLDAYYSLETVPEWNTTKRSMASNIPINDNFAMRVAYSSDQSDGWVTNGSTSETEPQITNEAVRLTFLYEMDDMEVNLKYFSSDSDRVGQHSQITNWGLVAAPPVLGAAGKQVAIAVFSIANVAFPGIAANGVGQDFTTYQNFRKAVSYQNENGGTNDADNFVLNIKTSLNDHDVQWTSSMSEYDFTEGADADFTPLHFITVSGNEQYEATTHEFVITSPSNDIFEYIAGFYIEETEYSFQNDAFLDGTLGTPGVTNAVLTAALGIGGTLWNAQSGGRLPASILATHHLHDLETSSQSVFFEGTYYASDKLSLTAGVRWSEDEKELNDSQFMTSDITGGNNRSNATLNPGVRAVLFGALGRDTYEFPLQTMKEDHVTPSFKVNYEYSDSTRLYLSWAEGYKSAGFDGSDNVKRVNYTTPDASSRFKAEEATTVEYGAKFDFAEQNLRANIAAFSTDYTNMQVSAFVGASFVVSNAGASTIEGIEGDFQWSPLDGLLIGGAFTQLDVSFDSFIGGCTVAQDIAYRAANRTVVSTPMGPRVIYGTCTQDLKGKTGVFAPEMSTSLFAEYVVAGTSDFNIVLGADVNKVGEFYSQNDLDPANLSPETTKANLRMGVEAADEKWSVTIFGRNVTNEIGRSFGVDLPLISGSHVAYLDPGREVGMRFRVNF